MTISIWIKYEIYEIGLTERRNEEGILKCVEFN